jgi:hypothetical protein
LWVESKMSDVIRHLAFFEFSHIFLS